MKQIETETDRNGIKKMDRKNKKRISSVSCPGSVNVLIYWMNQT